MKQGKKPTYTQRKLIEQWNLDPRDWFVSKDTPEYLLLVHRYSDKTTKTLPKE